MCTHLEEYWSHCGQHTIFWVSLKDLIHFTVHKRHEPTHHKLHIASTQCHYLQGVVTYVEEFATEINNLDRWKSSLIAWSLHSKALDGWEFKGQNVVTPPWYQRKCVDQLILVTKLIFWSAPKKNIDHLIDSILIPIASASVRRISVSGTWPCRPFLQTQSTCQIHINFLVTLTRWIYQTHWTHWTHWTDQTT